MKERRPAPSGEADGIIEGRNAVTEALRAGTPIDKIYLARGETDAALGHIASTARSKGVVVVECDRRKLDGMSRTHSHQGVIALAAVREYASVDGILETARATGTWLTAPAEVLATTAVRPAERRLGMMTP